MSKRRTKKEKINPKRNISISWQPEKTEAKNSTSEADVKRQLLTDTNKVHSIKEINKLTIFTDKNSSLASVKKDLIKSLIFAVLIVASEVVIYLVWT